jgi:hypothetical protein
MVKSSTESRGLSSNASKGLDASDASKVFSLTMCAESWACRLPKEIEGSEAPEGCLRSEMGACRFAKEIEGSAMPKGYCVA